ncbi:hypothetical protein [Tolypothrix sp. VBCCA 56010]|uniref:hypothetical protein n=1 Tax=Tolypothrix sp. VBCCA 56010 TaxID=3137731 RepID=UPI003D7DC0C5
MPHVTLDIAADGCRVQVIVSATARWAEFLKQAKLDVPEPVICQALIDTGATRTCVDPTVLNQLWLTPKGRLPVLTPSTGAIPHYTNLFDVGIHLYYAGTVLNPESKYLLSHEIAACESDLLAQGIHVLLGMDVLSRCLLIVDGAHQRFTLGI